MGKITATALVALLATLALPASASLADRKTETPAAPAPYSGHVVIRGEVIALDHTATQRTFIL